MRTNRLVLLALFALLCPAQGAKLDWQQIANQCNAANGMLTDDDFMHAVPLQRRNAMDCVDYYHRHGRMPPNAKALEIDADRHADWIHSLCMQSRDYTACKAWADMISLTQTEAWQLVRYYHKERL